MSLCLCFYSAFLYICKLPWLSRQSERLLTVRSMVRSHAEAFLFSFFFLVSFSLILLFLFFSSYSFILILLFLFFYSYSFILILLFLFFYSYSLFLYTISFPKICRYTKLIKIVSQTQNENLNFQWRKAQRSQELPFPMNRGKLC